jgi:class 3 adenylate cyclase
MSSTKQTTRLAILFADISVNSALYEKIGDELTRRLVKNCLDLMQQEVQRHQGRLVQTIVNEILCSFATPSAAVLAACAMQNAVQRAQLGGDYPLHIRIGIHYGEVSVNGDDISGEPVNVAARVTAITRARQIMTTRHVAEALPEELRSKVRQVQRARAHSKKDTFDVFLVTWEFEDTTLTRVGLPQSREPREARNELLLRYRDQLIVLSEQSKSVVLGRGDSCDLIIQNSHASRQHARIEFYFNKFVLVDYSANGTYIRFSDKRVSQLLHSEITLHGSGTISLGQPYAENPVELIEFILQ